MQIKDQFMNIVNPNQDKQRQKQDKEISGYTLVGRGGWLTYCKIMVGILLAVWNANLFINTIAGPLGQFTAFFAINLEMMALYCVHNYVRSIGDHKKWLGRFAIILGIFSLTHAVFAIVHYTGYAPHNTYIDFYSHLIALPIIVILLSWSVAKLSMKHFSATIIQELAKTKVQSLIKRAEVLMQQNQLHDAQEVSILQAKLFEAETVLKTELIPIIRRRIVATEQLKQMIRDIDDPHTRDEIRHDIEELDGNKVYIPTPPIVNSSPKVSPQPSYTNGGNGSNGNNGGTNAHPTQRW